MSGGGDSTPPTQQVNSTTTTNNLPEYARPYYENILQRSQAESYRPYTPYEGQRIAGFTPDQQALQTEVRNMQTPGQFGAASDLAYGAGLGAANVGQYAPTAVVNQQVQMPHLDRYSMMGPGNVFSREMNAPMMDTAQTGFNPNLQDLQMGGPREVGSQQVSGYTVDAARTNFNPNLQNLRMDAPEQFGNQQAQQYMSPYVQNVLDVQKREAVRDAQKTQLAQDLGAARQGTYGGARQLLAATERERALGQQLGDIQARGLQSSYENAQAQFERDRSAGMTAGQQNLQAGLQTQQLGTQTGLQAALANLSSEQQTNAQNQAAINQAMGMNAEQAMRAALANQQAGLTVGQQNLQAGLQTQQLGTQTGLQAALANLSSSQQANVQNQAAQLQTQGLNSEQAMRAALANQQMGFNVGQQNLQAAMQRQQLGTQSGLQAALANQSSNLDAQRLAEQSRQFGSQQGLAANAQALEAGRTLGNLGLTQQQADMQRLGIQGASADQYQLQRQRQYDMAYADFLRQRDYPMELLGQYSNLLRGVPVGLNTTGTTYATPPSMAAQLGGVGLGAASLAQLSRG